jgi:hypothetical protein
VVFSAHLANLPDEIVLDLAANEFQTPSLVVSTDLHMVLLAL